MRPVRAGPATAYFFFLGFLTSFFGLLSFATEILPYGVDYNRMLRQALLCFVRENADESPL